MSLGNVTGQALTPELSGSWPRNRVSPRQCAGREEGGHAHLETYQGERAGEEEGLLSNKL